MSDGVLSEKLLLLAPQVRGRLWKRPLAKAEQQQAVPGARAGYKCLPCPGSPYLEVGLLGRPRAGRPWTARVDI